MNAAIAPSPSAGNAKLHQDRPTASAGFLWKRWHHQND
jgi:hypothetical protein